MDDIPFGFGEERAPRRRGAAPVIPAPPEPRCFENDDELLDFAQKMFKARRAVSETEDEAWLGKADRNSLTRLKRRARQWTRFWHDSFSRSAEKCHLVARCQKRELVAFERELVALLAARELGLAERHGETNLDLLNTLGVQGRRRIEALRMLSEEGRLAKSEMVAFADVDEDIARRTPILDPSVTEGILFPQEEKKPRGLDVENESDLYAELEPLTHLLSRKNDILDTRYGFSSETELFKINRRIERIVMRLFTTLQERPDWAISKLLNGMPHPLQIMVLTLIGKEVGHLTADNDLYTGGGLARAAAEQSGLVSRMFVFLRPGARLTQEGVIQACDASSEMLSDNPGDLETAEFELTTKSIERLGLGKQLIKQRKGAFQPRPAKVQLDHLVLSDDVRRALDLTIAQIEHGETMLSDWGLGKLVPYGRGVSLLFSGPPGTGKTATAEALAHKLNRPIMVADYSRIQNCLVGQTEKNIVRVFREARSHNAVLFWDEADAMFFDRDDAHRSWEVRDVNMLLTELEKFDGVCVLATNRVITLDKALERRIAMKIEFQRPDRATREGIWKKLLPAEMPLAEDVNVSRLAEYDLTGGEIKNVVLTAARLALHDLPSSDDSASTVTAAHFATAIDMEQGGQWSKSRRKAIGFGATRQQEEAGNRVVAHNPTVKT